LILTREVENFPGFPENIAGSDLMERMRAQVEKFGVQTVCGDVTAVDLRNYPFKIFVDEDEYQGRAIIVATGASPKWLGLPNEERLRGRGVSSCATCDAPLFKGANRAVIVGGGDTTMEYALFTARMVNEVVVVHRRDKLRASLILQERAFANPRIRFVWNSIVIDILGDKKVEGVKVKNLMNSQESIIECDVIFVAIGHRPNTEVFKGQLEMDEDGYLIVRDGNKTSVEGVFAAGDAHDRVYRQAVTAAGFGCMAAVDAIRWLQTSAPQLQKPT